MSNKQTTSKIKSIPVWLAVIIIICLAFNLGREMSNSASEEQTVEKTLQTLDVTVLQQRLAKISELATVSYEYTDIARHKKTEKIWGYSIPGTTSTILLRYSGVIKAGVDLHDAKINVKDTTVILTLPAPKVLSHSVDPSSIKIINQSNGLFSSIKIADFQAFCSAHQDSMQTVAINSGLLQNAAASAADGLELIAAPLRDMGYNVIVTVNSDTLSMPEIRPLLIPVENNEAVEVDSENYNE